MVFLNVTQLGTSAVLVSKVLLKQSSKKLLVLKKKKTYFENGGFEMNIKQFSCILFFTFCLPSFLSCASSKSNDNDEKLVPQENKDTQPNHKPTDPNRRLENSDTDTEEDLGAIEDPLTCQSPTDMSPDCLDERKRAAFLFQ